MEELHPILIASKGGDPKSLLELLQLHTIKDVDTIYEPEVKSLRLYFCI